MLNKIISLNNLGVFQHGTPNAANFDRVTLLYAENGRGKSTISAALASLSTGDIDALVARRTFGGGSQKVVVRCTTGGVSVNAQFDGTKWSATVPNIIVFDQHFIERNVYAGSEVQTSHHEALLEFALGTASVKKKLEVEAPGKPRRQRPSVVPLLKTSSRATWERHRLLSSINSSKTTKLTKPS
jgi:wobble nucleotide-excising tRNase